MRLLQSFVLCLFLVAPTKSFANSFDPSSGWIEYSGDVFQIVNPLLAAGVAIAHKDAVGLRQLGTTVAVTVGSTMALKYAFNGVNIGGYNFGERPNGGDLNFPSGHTSTVFAASHFTWKRYGAYFGIPLTAFSIFTAYSRVQSDNHDVWAVLGGALLGSGIAHFLTSKYDLPIAAGMMAVPGGGGVSLRVAF